MEMSESNSTARRAALLLHALPATEQDKVLARLPQTHQLRLQALMQELHTLGIPKDPAWIDHAREPGWQGDIDRLSASSVMSVLSRQSLATAAYVLSSGHWSWKTQVLAEWPEENKAALLASMPVDLPDSPALVRFLLDQLLRAVRSEIAGQPTQPRVVTSTSWLRRIFLPRTH
jgi:flagellar motor switch protein FliG